MSDNVVLNSNHIVNAGNNKMVYKFPRDVKFGKNDKLAVSHFNVYYSWFNISAKYNNNFFQYKWFNNTNGDVDETFDVVIPDGFYTVYTLYEFFQSKMVESGHVLETIDGSNYVYFIEFLTNSTYYAIEMRLSSVSTVMDFTNSGQTSLVVPTDESTQAYVKAPTGWVLPAEFKTPQIIIPSNSNFGKLFGFKPATIYEDIPGSVAINKQYSFLNDIVPNMNPSSSFVITCNLINNDFSIPNDVLYSFTIPSGVSFGDLITSNTDFIYSRIREGTYREVILSIKDQDFNDLQIIDPNMLIVLSILRES